MINFTEPYHSYNQDKKNLEKAITKVLKDGSYILGKNVKLFEKNFSRYLNIKYSVAVANGTDAILLVFKALNFTVPIKSSTFHGGASRSDYVKITSTAS